MRQRPEGRVSEVTALHVIVRDTRRIEFPTQEGQTFAEIIDAVAERVRESEAEGFRYVGMGVGLVEMVRAFHPPSPPDPFGERIKAALGEAENGAVQPVTT